MLFARFVSYDTTIGVGFNEWEPSLGWQNNNKDYILYTGSVLMDKEEDKPYHHTFVLEVTNLKPGKKRREVHFGTMEASESSEFYQSKDYRDFLDELPKRRYRIAARDLEKAIELALVA